MKLTLAISLAALFSVSAFGHARLAATSDVTPRSTNPGLKAGPCGNVARTATAKALTAGQTITVRWEETVQHTGSFFIEFSPANDANWVRLKTVVDNQDGPTSAGAHQFNTTVTVPNTPCANCTLRLVQEMLDNHPLTPTYYYSCGDISVAAATSATPTPSPGAIPTPTPAPVPDEYAGGEPSCAH